jgi:glutamyl-Q tRNA(Asp) synthetase
MSSSSSATAYRGRFAPSPSGPLHLGSLATALASWLDARAHNGHWAIRIEDVDEPRCVPGADAVILRQLAACGLIADEPPVWQSMRTSHYEAALAQLMAEGWAYPCGCTRSDITQVLEARGIARERHAELVYPGTCRRGLHGKPARAMRLLTTPTIGGRPQALVIDWRDRLLGAQHQDVTSSVGDFVLRRADGLWAYQLAVVVDDAAQRITHVVRGQDIADNTARQIHLQRVLGLPTPIYLHTPLALADDGQKLSKQNGAYPLDIERPLATLQDAGRVLGLEIEATEVNLWLSSALNHWRARWLA